MTRTYTKPPFVEAVCDLRFSSSNPWDWTIPGLFYDQIRDRFPVKEQLNTIETRIDPVQGKVVQQTQLKLQFSSEMRDAVIQISPDNLSIHQLPPYDGWVNFRERIFEYLQIYRSAAQPAALTNIALRYINHVELPFDDIELENYFCVLPQIPNPIPQVFPTFLVNVEIPYSSPVSGLKITFGTVVPRVSGNLAYVLDLNMLSSSDAIPSSNQILNWLDIVHDRIEVAFNASFTAKTHLEIFGAVNT